MYIKDLYIKNFRSIDYLHLELTEGKNVVVGKNNAGKSNIIKALDICFGDRNPQYADVAYTDFHEHEKECCDHFWILCRLANIDINEEEIIKIKGVFRGKLEGPPFNYDNSTGEISLNDDRALFEADVLFSGYSNKVYFKPNGTGSSAIQELISSLRKADDGLWVLFHAQNAEDSDTPCIKEYRFFYKEVNGSQKTWFTLWGISPAFRDALVTSAILPAFREPATQLKATAWSWYGKLLKKVWDDKKRDAVNDGENLTDALTAALGLVETVGNGIYENLANEIKSKISIAFNDTSVKFRYFHNLKDIYKQVQVFVNDGFDSNLQNKGSGIQSAVIIGLFSYYCSTFHHNNTILAIEEPELYLHPQARRVISKRLSDFVRIRADKQNQVIVITHSTEFIRAGELNNISVIKKIAGRTSSANYKIDVTDKSEIQTLLRSENSEMFFADKVIICEGGEKFILPAMADSLSGKEEHLDESNITIARANGKGNIDKIRKVLDKCNIEHYTIADLDYLFRGLDHEINPLIGGVRALVATVEQDWAKEKTIRKHIATRGDSRDAAAFCDQMEIVASNPATLPDLLGLWEFIRPKLRGKMNHEYLDTAEGEPLKAAIEECLTQLWEKERIYILRRGELEDYLTPDGKDKVAGSKETKLLKIRDMIEDGHSIDSFFLMDEFNTFLGGVLAEDDLQSIPAATLVQQAPEGNIETNA